jgi:lipoate---protein ligase
VSPWTVEVRRGTAGELHALELPEPATPMLWWMELERPAVVLGSTQSLDLVDRTVATRRGYDVVRRRSGGGAVLLRPGSVTWVDVIIPVDHPRWERDVGRAFWWLGEAWQRALGSLGVVELDVHRGALVRRPWSELVCFGGLGAGELTMGGRKVLGLSQRRTRAGARFQCLLEHRWDPGALLEVLVMDDRDRQAALAALEPEAVGVDPLPAGEVQGALLAALTEPL